MIEQRLDQKPIRIGMVGGGKEGLIGSVHRMAIQLDGHYQLVAGAFGSTAERSLESGLYLGVDAERCYPDFQTMADKELKRPDGIEAVIIVTPTFLHFEPIKAFLNAGIHVFCDKPLTTTLAEAEALKGIVEKSDAHFIITHNYSANAMVRQARAMVANGDLGDIRIIHSEYVQGWLSKKEDPNNKQAAWRTSPKVGSGCIGDIGTHAFQLMCYVSGLTPTKVQANLSSFVPGRQVDDDVQVLLEFNKGAKGMLWTSQVAEGGENGLKVRIYGTKGTLEWEQEQSDILWFNTQDGNKQRITRNGVNNLPEALRSIRSQPGHPEGYIEAFANIYTEMAMVIKAERTGEKHKIPDQLPTFEDGLLGMQFIDTCQKSSATRAWTDFPD